MSVTPDDAYLRALARRFPTRQAAIAEIAHLASVLTLKKGTVHVVSDVHGEDKKLSHVIRNASGGLRALVDTLFAERLPADDRKKLLSLVYYVRETWMHDGVDRQPAADRLAYVERWLGLMLDVIRALAERHSQRALVRILPVPYQELFLELIGGKGTVRRDDRYLRALVQPLVARAGGGLDVLRLASRVVRNLSVHELVVAGDLGDRGPRLDRVVDVLMKQPNVSIVWGNHDALWMGACLGHEALIATVVRVSLRYRRLSQLEEGYGIPMAPVEKLARDVYGDDPCERFLPKGEGLRDPLLMARMQKAMAILQFKLEAQAAARNPDFAMEHRSLLSRIDFDKGIVALELPRDGKPTTTTFELRDKHLPTVDPKDPTRLSPDEERCLARLRQSFVSSSTLWTHMQFLRARGCMLLVRDHNLIFHGCLPVDDSGAFLSMSIDGAEHRGKALLHALERVVHRAFRGDPAQAPAARQRDLDLLWYLWTGERSPLFGKDRMATFEGYFVADEAAKKENKNPYFKLQNEVPFAEAVFRELGADPRVGFIVNGHVPVKPDKGDAPLKRSKMAVTIDGAFSEAYGDRGYTLILDAERTALAEHHHFESVAAAVASGADIVPTVHELRRFDPPRTVADTEKGAAISAEIDALDALIAAYDDNTLWEAGGS